jgi:hypothetical protein
MADSMSKSPTPVSDHLRASGNFNRAWNVIAEVPAWRSPQMFSYTPDDRHAIPYACHEHFAAFEYHNSDTNFGRGSPSL